MKRNINEVINWLKIQPVDASITGSCLLDYFEGQDVDCFVHNEISLRKLLFAMHYNDNFQLLEPLEEWKFNEYINKGKSSIKKIGLLTIKFKYNLCIDVNVIFKKYCINTFSVLSSFDLNIVCKGWDIMSQQELDITGNTGKVASWNRWNPTFRDEDVWTINRLLRQFERCIKYHNRGYNTDEVVEKYIEMAELVIKQNSVFNSIDFNERLKLYKKELRKVITILRRWLKTHKITEEEVNILKEKINMK